MKGYFPNSRKVKKAKTIANSHNDLIKDQEDTFLRQEAERRIEGALEQVLLVRNR